MAEEKDTTTLSSEEVAPDNSAAPIDNSATQKSEESSKEAEANEDGKKGKLAGAIDTLMWIAQADGKDDKIKFMDDRHFADLKEFVGDRAADGELSEDDLDAIMKKTRKMQDSHGWLTEKQADELVDYARSRSSESIDKKGKKLPWPLRIFAILYGAMAAIMLFFMVLVSLALIYAFSEGTVNGAGYTTVEIVLGFVLLFLQFCNTALAIVLCVRLARNKRAGAERASHVGILLGVLTVIVVSMSSGISSQLVSPIVMTILMVVLGVYLNPNLVAERQLRNQLLFLNTENRAKTGKLGLDLEGAGFIRLDFFNIFWIFIIAAVLGLLIEDLFHFIVVEPGVWQNRAGLLYGPFSPIYGFGAVLFTLVLNRFKKGNIILIFLACTILGGAFEYFVSWWMETAFGIIAWDYHGEVLGDFFDGRTCLLFASMFGFLGAVWIKWLLPVCLVLINKIPWKARYIITAIAAVLMFVDCVMTVEALDCWFERMAGLPVTTDIQQFYAENYPNDVMQQRFENMNLDPSRAARG